MLRKVSVNSLGNPWSQSYSHIDMQTHSGHPSITLSLTSDRSTSGSMHAESLPWSKSLATLALLA